MVGSMLVLIGFGTYYVVPLTFIHENLALFFFLLNCLMIGVILGLTFLAVLVFKYLEWALLWLVIKTCGRRDARLHQVILKNLSGHRGRNLKTSIMFTLALSFLIFSATGFDLMNSLIQSEIETFVGADFYANEIGDSFLN